MIVGVISEYNCATKMGNYLAELKVHCAMRTYWQIRFPAESCSYRDGKGYN